MPTTISGARLSKSQYMRGHQCLKSLWLFRHRKDLQGPVDEFQQSLFDSGTEFGKLATQRFPGGVRITNGHDDPEGARAATSEAIDGGATILYEAAFLHDDVLVRADIIRKNEDGTWDLLEVKSSTKVSPEYVLDVAVQLHVLRGAGLSVRSARVVLANSGYVRRGALDINALFTEQDVTAEAADFLPDIAAEVAKMKAVADAAEPPVKAIGEHCAKPYACDFRSHCWAHVPAYSVFNLGYAKMEKKLELFNSGIKEVSQIDPATTKLTAGQKAQVMAARSGKANVNKEAIRKFLETLVYPLTFLDFETDVPVVPPYDGLHPYSQMPFQAALCIQEKPCGDVVKHDFLGSGLADPRDGLTDFLLRMLPPSGSVLAYHKSFEAGRIEELAQEPSARPLLAVLERLLDLADPFRTNAYTHPDFRGRWSIKAVLPVLVPTMTYKGMEVGDGAAAMAAYGLLRDPNLPEAERARLSNALRAYCAQDVYGMLKILEHLYQVTGLETAP